LFSNKKPWVTPDLKALTNEKRSQFRSRNKELQKEQNELRRKVREAKTCYRKKMMLLDIYAIPHFMKMMCNIILVNNVQYYTSC